MVLAVEATDFEDIVAYFSSNKISQQLDNKANEIKLGKRIFSSGIKSKFIPACASCHGREALGNSEMLYPSLASQHEEYIAKTLKDFRQARRKNDKGKVMRSIAAKLSDKEIEALAVYISNL
jgi:cytochrome c553